ncbi:transcriptional regulator, GntR family [Caenispirillum salinarum AK4]|uniref:Transcriptional regulator, GntR family n=1 Tax=Caenispirillum salinarum AK4 TaxID=1238182 RepID=K9GV11_9PROT|nr:GntR family transcriptional regulator [Caenispirillum salinarum]EKV29830.1 transcriptional regulator, GntR family [Caenispirillum salinarum AK4]
MTRNDHTIARAPTLTQSVAERINDAILDGTFEPGERLVETRLSGMFGVSRAPVREALKILETTGLVRIVVGRGTFVCRLNRDELMRVVVGHALLMGFAARLASVHGTARSFTALARAQRGLTRAVDAGRATEVRRQEDVFLTALFDAAEDTVLRQTVLGMRGQILVHRSPLTPEAEILDRLGATAAELLSALTEGDPDQAERTARTATLVTGFAIIGQKPPPSVDAYLDIQAPRMPAELTA